MSLDLRPLWRVPLYFAVTAVAHCVIGLLQVIVGPVDPFLAALGAVTFATWIMVKYIDHGSLADLGLRRQDRTLMDLSLGLLSPIVLLTGIFALEWLAGWLLIARIAAPGPAALAVVTGRFIAVAWYEELFTRGYLMQTVARSTGFGPANIITALIFAAMHLANPGASFMAFVGVFIAGWLLGLCYQVTKSLYLPMAFHLGWNMAQALLGFPVSGLNQAGFFQLIREGPVLYTGGAFGPEAGIFGFCALAVAVGLVMGYGKYRAQGASIP